MLWNGRNGSNGYTAENPTQNMVNAYEMENGELPYLNEELPLQVNPLPVMMKQILMWVAILALTLYPA